MKKDEKARIEIVKDGPYMVYGDVPLIKESIDGFRDGNHIFAKWGKEKPLNSSEKCSLCRCGASKNHPFCDGAHLDTGFSGEETAKRENFTNLANNSEGQDLILYDQEDLCFGAGFCHSEEGSTWELFDSEDKKLRDIAIRQAKDCPSGRLVMYDKKTKKMIEYDFKPSISVIEENRKNVSGPLMVKGGIQIISSDGFKYEKRNRVTLCRCGQSDNKPFCDGAHSVVGFKANEKNTG
jgi:CDGSH-type Zn-finger protein